MYTGAWSTEYLPDRADCPHGAKKCRGRFFRNRPAAIGSNFSRIATVESLREGRGSGSARHSPLIDPGPRVKGLEPPSVYRAKSLPVTECDTHRQPDVAGIPPVYVSSLGLTSASTIEELYREAGEFATSIRVPGIPRHQRICICTAPAVRSSRSAPGLRA